MIDIITNHPIVTGAIAFFIIAAIFTIWEVKHALDDPEETEDRRLKTED